MILAAVIVATALVVSAYFVRDGLLAVSKSFGWGEQTSYVDLDKLLTERAQAELDAWDEDDLVLGTDITLR